MDIKNAHFVTVFDWSTAQAKPIVYLHLLDLAICAAIGLLVFALVAYAAVKFRHREGDVVPNQDHGNVKLETIWTVVPLIMVTVLGMLAAVVMKMSSPPPIEQPPDLIVIGHQWWWEYRYPKFGIVTANEFYLPRDADMLLEVRSADVNHSFCIPNFGQKMDAIPGHPNKLFWKATKTGLFLGMCSEFCGDQHALMRIIARVLAPKEFDVWVRRQQVVSLQPADEHALHGKQLFAQATCIECHAIAGTEANAEVGPNLTHISERTTLGSGVIPNNLDNLTQWIINPQRYKPGVHMPNMRLAQNDARDIALYLESLK